MAKITWLGEKDGPSHIIWNGIMFPKGQAVEVDDVHIVNKAKGNHFYQVEERRHVEIKEGEEGKEEGKEEGEKAYHYSQAEKGSGYVPVKKKVRKKKTGGTPPAAPTTPDS